MKILAAQPIIESIIPTIPSGLHLAVILVGNDDASHIYVQKKSEALAQVAGKVSIYDYPDTIDELSILNCIDELNTNPSIDGIIIQLPLPSHLNEQNILNHISYTKDADGLTDYWLGKLFQSTFDSSISPIIPATPKGILALLEYYQISLKEKIILILNDSVLVGKPLATIVSSYGATAITANQYTPHIIELISYADIIVSAIGKPDIFSIENFTEKQVIIDVGITRDTQGKIRGDIYTKNISFAGDITPVPGGIGPLTVWALIQNIALLQSMFHK
jgi:methylenetetrahydrofolate dehydrogenase (NADP+)/methenyltetrahydrofolate cyclohydrolase